MKSGNRFTHVELFRIAGALATCSCRAKFKRHAVGDLVTITDSDGNALFGVGREYDKFYITNNMGLIISAGFDLDAVLSRVRI